MRDRGFRDEIRVKRESMSEARGSWASGLPGLLFLEIVDAFLNTAFESVRSDASAEAGSVGIRTAQAEAPGGPVSGQGAAEIGVFSQVFTGSNPFADFARSFHCHIESSLPYYTGRINSRFFFTSVLRPDVSGHWNL